MPTWMKVILTPVALLCVLPFWCVAAVVFLVEGGLTRWVTDFYRKTWEP